MTIRPAVQIRLMADSRADLEAASAELVAAHAGGQMGAPYAGRKGGWLAYGTLAVTGSTAPVGALPAHTQPLPPWRQQP